MKVLLDEMLPAGVAGLLPGHEVTTVQQAGFKGLPNGELLRQAARAATRCSSLPTAISQPSRTSRRAASPSSSCAAVACPRSAGQATQIQAAVAGAQPGTVTRVEPG